MGWHIQKNAYSYPPRRPTVPEKHNINRRSGNACTTTMCCMYRLREGGPLSAYLCNILSCSNKRKALTRLRCVAFRWASFAFFAKERTKGGQCCCLQSTTIETTNKKKGKKNKLTRSQQSVFRLASSSSLHGHVSLTLSLEQSHRLQFPETSPS